MAKRVLNVGQCGPDHAGIRALVEGRFGAEVVRADNAADALEELRGGEYDLVLINRLLDCDGSEGMDVLKKIKSDDALAAVPVMLVTNYPEYQRAAVAAGGVQGFGKAELDRPETVERLHSLLG